MSDITPQNDFEQAIIDFFEEIGKTVVDKNRLYGDSYRIIRERAKFDKRDQQLPFWVHINEKMLRYGESKPGDTEDPLMDIAGYAGLEAVCRRFDDVDDQ